MFTKPIVMKKIYLLLVVFLFVLAFSCKKAASSGPVGNNGTYVGNVNVYLNTLTNPDSVLSGNGTLNGTLVNHSISVTSTSGGTMTLQTGLIYSTAATVSGNIFTIAKHTVLTTSDDYVVEYGTGTFVNNALVIDLHQDQILNTGNITIAKGTWIGTLAKQ